jgi:hypothetical protein
MKHYDAYGILACIPWFLFSMVITGIVSLLGLVYIPDKIGHFSFVILYFPTLILVIPFLMPLYASFSILNDAWIRLFLGDTNFLGRPRHDSRIFLRKLVAQKSKGGVE